MAVFPDRIVLKNSTDSQAVIEAAIATGGTDAITQGEIVLGLETSSVSIYTKASDGSIVSFAPGSASGRAIVSNTAPTTGVNNLPLADGDLWYESDTGSYYVYYLSAWVGVNSGVTSLADVDDVIDYAGFVATGSWDSEIVTQTTGGSDFPNAAGEWATYESSAGDAYLMAHFTDSNTVDHTSLFDAVALNPTDYSFKLRVNSGTETAAIQLTAASNQGSGRYRFDFNVTDLDPATVNQGGYSGANPSTGGNGPFANTLELQLVLTSTLTPDDGQVLTWDGTNNRWEPADAAGGGGGSVASLDDVGDVQYPTGNFYLGLTNSTGTTTTTDVDAAGKWAIHSSGLYLLYHTDDSADVEVLQAGDTVTFEAYGLTHTTTMTGGPFTDVASVRAFQVTNQFPSDWLGPTLPSGQALTMANASFPTATVDPSDGQVLTWVDANNQWEPASPASGGGGSSLDPLFSLVTVLAPFDNETNGATTWTSYGSTSPTWTANSSAISNTLTRWGGTTSLDVSSTSASIPCSLGTDDWTIEMWTYLDLGTWNNFGSFLRNGLLSDTFDAFYFGPNGSTTTARCRISNSSTALLTVTGNCVWHDEEWNHLAICRSGDTFSAYVNGEKVGSGVQSGRTFNSGNIRLDASGSSTGYIQDFRVTSGVARYSTAFYPVPSFPLPQS